MAVDYDEEKLRERLGSRYTAILAPDPRKIRQHLGLWEVKPRPPPKADGLPKPPEYHIDYSTSPLPASDKWLYVDPEPACA